MSADLVLSATLAGLGEMRLVRARLVRSRDGLVVQDLQETIPGGPRVLQQTAADLVKRLFPERRSSSWYRKWWVWTIAAGVVGAAAGVTTWAVTRGSGAEREPNLVHIGDL